MEFAFNEEQLMIQESAESFLRDKSTSESIRRVMDTDTGYCPELWQSICQDMYWQAIHLPESCGGMGLGYVELLAVTEQMGRYLLCAPFFSSVALAANAILLAGSESQKQCYLSAIAEGKTATLAYSSSGSSQSFNHVVARCVADGDHYILNGDYQHVIDGASSEFLILAARDEQDDIQLFLVDGMSAGLEVQALPTMDQTRHRARLSASNLRLPASTRLSQFDNANTAFSAVLDLATIALAAEQVGLMQQLLDMAVAYTGERQQFNRPIASFQAIKHMAADMMLRTEVGRSAVYYAACIADEYLAGTGTSESLAEAASIAKAWCSESAFKNAADCLQMHGGVGFTWEYDVHLFFKRAKASEHFLGNSAQHRERIATMLLDEKRLFGNTPLFSDKKLVGAEK
ncbi:acyl-CoA/acyl-ACP dehydrogenase [Spongiibacter sp. KMU-158]|uniref:Acyl-CoA/acyl-ACP dehydrogenase n=1 Tax=Spongiibacter pelagi TaxID=2760804 RepID=A0A927BZA6_9GAMM|nr:acyl-CoA dehydrogenase family protein [Spongiibacter pelagi]MBD2858344.1 acyl-CoA/acyl-ACP dehydrogenase [Spongiibacter pelagi]